MTANNPNEAPEEETSATTRRRFLGAAAAIAGLPLLSDTGAAETNRDTSVEYGDYGTRKASLPTRGSLPAYMELYSVEDDDATFSATGWHYGDDEPGVGLKIGLSGGNVNMHISPERAREIANDILAAADHAEHGGAPNGSN